MSNLLHDFEIQTAKYRGCISPRIFDYSRNISSQFKYAYVETPKADDLHSVLRRINENYEPYLSDERRHSKNSIMKLADFYSSDLIRKVRMKYSEDFDCFGYEEDIGLASNPMPPTILSS